MREPLNNFEFISESGRGRGAINCNFEPEWFWDVTSEKNRKFPVNYIINNGEFDPGSERTLAAWIRHASRTRKFPSGSEYSGERVSNGWKTCPSMGDNSSNELLIPHTTF